MKLLLMSALVIAALGSTACAEARAERGHRGPHGLMMMGDADHNGAISHAEFDAAHAAMFDRMDADHDGQLTEAERTAARQTFVEHARERRHGGRRERRHGGSGRGAFMGDADANHDGAITREEAMQAFDRLDANHDGAVSREERPGGGEHMRHFGRGLHGADANGDGIISRAEFNAAGGEMFGRLDSNQDGQLTIVDRPAHGRRGPPPAE